MTQPPQQNPICPRCGNTLPTTRVRVPVYIDHEDLESGFRDRILVGYDWEDEIGDCVRCTGGY